MATKLKNWAVVECAFSAPELYRRSLTGNVSGHRDFPENAPIKTNYINNAEGRKVWTLSGSEYILDGDPNPDYVAWMKEHGIELDLENPIKILNKRP